MKNLGSLIPFILIALVFWFLIVRPQRRRQQELSKTQSSLEPGAEVMLGSGIFGTVVAMEDDNVRIDIAPGTTIKVARQAIVKVVSGVEPAEPDAPAAEPEEPRGGPGVDLSKDQPERDDK